MAAKMVGVGSQYAAAFVDAKGQPLDGGKTYRLHLPPNIPAATFWSLVLYDNQTRSMLQTDAPHPSIGSQQPGVVINPDTSVDVYFGPAAPAGKESNWVQTWPGKAGTSFSGSWAPPALVRPDLAAWRDRVGEVSREHRDEGTIRNERKGVRRHFAPWQNPFVERVIGTLRRECLDHVIVLERALAQRLHLQHTSSTRSRQLNTHNTELREVRYPFHPWFGRAVAVYEVLVKQGHSVCRCGLEEERDRLSREVPTWMFEPAACGGLRVLTVPTITCDALRALQVLLGTMARCDSRGVLQAQHRSLPAAGGADAPVRDPPTTLAADTVSSPPLGSVVSDVAARDPSEDDPIAGAAAARARRRRGRGRPGAGGA